MKILVVEDDLVLSAGLCFELDAHDYLSVAAYTCKKALQLLEEGSFDLALLDVNLPDGSGFDLCREIKSRFPGLPVIFLTANDLESDVLSGFDLGAEDYITKPFGLLELAARVRAALRRQPPERQHILRGGDIVVDVDDHAVTRAGQPLELTLKEFELLRILIANRERVVPREELLNEIWGYDFAGETRTLDMHIKTLRAKLGDDVEHPRYIKTIRAVGYKFIG